MINKKNKRLVVAIALLLLSATLLGTASFAWFGMNTSVNANGVEVEAYSDSQFLQITDTYTNDTTNNFNTDNTSVNLAAGQKNLMLITHGVISNKSEVFKLKDIAAASGNYDGTGSYYKLADTDSVDYDRVVSSSTPAGEYNFIYANGELATADSVKDLYKVQKDDAAGFGFARVDGGTYASGTYYEKVGNNYVPATLSTGNSTHGYYLPYTFTKVTGTGTTAAADTVYYEKIGTSIEFKVVPTEVGVTEVTGYFTTSAISPETDTAYTGSDTYYKVDSGTYSKADTLKLGTSLVGYYTLTEVASTDTTDFAEPSFNGTDYYYIKNNTNDYVCIGKPASGTAFEGYIYWGRAYSSEYDNVQAGNTLNIVGEKSVLEKDYYFTDTLYLRQATGTNHAKNLRIEKVTVNGTNSLDPALRILFVAKSLVTGETTTVVYNNRDHQMTTGTTTAATATLFDTIFGDTQEVIQVDFYVYYDGKDDTAKNTNIATLSGQTVEIEFAIDELEYNK